MKLSVSSQFLLTVFCAISLQTYSFAQSKAFSFGVIMHPLKGTLDESSFRNIITESADETLAFIVTNGIKLPNEPCSDVLYQRRKEILSSAKNSLIVSLAGSDWSECKNLQKRSVAVERLNRLRELFFNDDFSLGANKIRLIRQSSSAKFRNYPENTRWEMNNIMFATINLPASNNHYRNEAGRNSEFEDRLIANRDWLERIFTFAKRKKMAGIVLFCDGDLLSKPSFAEFFDFAKKRDGFSEVRKHIMTQTSKFNGKVLLVHSTNEGEDTTLNASNSNGITWYNKLGELRLFSGSATVTVAQSNPALFILDSDLPETSSVPE